MVGHADVEAKHKELLQLKSKVQQIQSNYTQTANARVANQKKMAKIVQTVQERTKDVGLIEDVIIVSLRSEISAMRSKGELPQAPDIDRNNQPSGETPFADEAYTSHVNQIEKLIIEENYRNALLQSEKLMLDIYKTGIQNIISLIKNFGQNEPNLLGQIQNIAK